MRQLRTRNTIHSYGHNGWFREGESELKKHDKVVGNLRRRLTFLIGLKWRRRGPELLPLSPFLEAESKSDELGGRKKPDL